MTRKFRERGYTERQLDTALEKISNRSRTDLFTAVPKNNNSIPLFITKYSRTAKWLNLFYMDVGISYVQTLSYVIFFYPASPGRV